MVRTNYLGRFIRECRTSLGLTSRKIEALSSKGGYKKISHSNLLAMERGDHVPTFDKILTLSLLFNVPTHHFEERLKLDMLGPPEVPEGAEYESLMDEGKELLSFGEYEKAMECFSQSYMIVEREKSEAREKAGKKFEARLHVANCRRRIGIPLVAKGEIEELLSDEALPDELVVKASFVLSEIYRELRNFRLALRHAEDTLELAQKIKVDDMAARVLNTMAHIHFQKEDYEKAAGLFRRTMKMFKALGDEKASSLVKRNLAMCYASKKKYNEAIRLLEEGLVVARESRESRAVATGLTHFQKVYFMKRSYALSRKYGKEAKELAQEKDYKDLLFFSIYYLWKVAEAEKKEELASIFHERLRSISRKVEGSFPELEDFRVSIAKEGH